MALDRIGDFGRGDFGSRPPQQRTILERIPPQNIEAEQALLGAMLLGDRAAIEKATEMVSREDFYRDAHGHIFEAMVALTEKDEPVDLITLKEELTRRSLLDHLGGVSYLMALADALPSAANVAYYAKIVQEKAILRRLIEASSQIAGLAYGDVDDVDQMVDQAERTIFEVSAKRSTNFFFPLRPLLNEAFEKIDTLYHEKGVTTGVDTGFSDLNYITSGLQSGDLVIIAARPSMGKTSLAVGIGQNAALNQSKPSSVAIFSLEMSKEQLVQRMICSEARVDAHRLRTGYLQDNDWTRIAGAVQKFWEANIFIDDSTDLSSLEMRAKCRRLRAEYGLDMVIVDYLQLMRGHGKNNENRNQEITEIARGLKSLAREMKVPVIALSQLSRNVERREDKRPMLSDLRECVTGDTRLICADTGRLVPISSLKAGDRILSVAKDQTTVAAEVSQVWRKGVKPVFHVTTETGRVVTCTDNHPFLTQSGYKPLGCLEAGDLLATPLRLPEHGTDLPGRGAACRFLGYMAGDGHYGKHRTLSFISADREVYDDAKAIIARLFPEVRFNESTTTFKQTCYEVDFVFHHKEGRYGRPFGNPLINWLRELDILGQLCHDKRVPDWVFEAGAAGAREFLAGYLATDGCVKVRPSGKYDVHFDTVSHGLARDVQHLLLRLGVVATVQSPQRKDGIHRPIYRISVNPRDENLRRFAQSVRPVGRKGFLLQALLDSPLRAATNPGIFRLPPHVSGMLFDKTKHLRQQGRKLPAGAARQYWKPQGKRPRRDICLKWAQSLSDDELKAWAESDLLWERVRSIEPAGQRETWDVCVPATGNFIAEGIVVHNSGAIEAEADVVGFIYRPAYYERKEAVSQETQEQAEEARRPGEYEGEEAEIIIAKQRNGPTGTVKLAFLPKFARFDNLAADRQEDSGF